MGFVRYGVHRQLDDAATELIRQSLVGVTSMADKSDVLTPWKEKDRLSREVYSNSGTPDAAIRRGMYNRASWSTESGGARLNSRDGIARASRTQALAAFAEENRREDLGTLLGDQGFDR